MVGVFGKRNRATPREAFGEKGLSLAKELGLETDGPNGLFPSEEDYRQVMARARAGLELRTKQVNDYLTPIVGPECLMVPYFLIPESCWFGETGSYLLEFLRLTPYGEWNTIFLPGNQWTAAIMGTMQHPGDEVPGLTTSLKKLVQDGSVATAAAAEKVRKTGDVELMTEARNRQLAMILTVVADLARVIGEYGKPNGPDHRAGLAFLSPALRPG